jgi:hypothetical protein
MPSVHTKHPGKSLDLAMWSSRAVRRRSGQIPARPAAVAGRVWVEGGLGSPRLDLRAQSGRRAVGELARWSPAAAATGARAPVKLRRWQGNKWHREIEWGRAEPLVSSGGAGNNKWWRFGRGSSNGGWQRVKEHACEDGDVK